MGEGDVLMEEDDVLMEEDDVLMKERGSGYTSDSLVSLFTCSEAGNADKETPTARITASKLILLLSDVSPATCIVHDIGALILHLSKLLVAIVI